MTSETVAVGSRKFNWADDDDDDFDLDSWNATADTSAPTAAELGPLQVPPTEDETKGEEETYTLSRIRNERACWDPPATKEPFDTEPTQDPEPTVQLPAQYWYLAVLNCRPEHQVMSARFDRITRAIGFCYDGKEEPEAPAYPELSSSKAYRSRYMKGFQNWKLENRSLSSSKVYRDSPLNIVTSIENAHEIDDVVDGADDKVEEVLDEYGALQVAAQKERVEASDFDAFARDQEANREMNEEIDRMLVDQSRNNVDVSERFSRKELEGLYHQYKAQQLETAESDAREVHAETGVGSSEEEDTAWIYSWENRDWDEELCKPYNPGAERDEMSFSVTGPMEDDEISLSITLPFVAVANEELEFNNVVFGDREEDQEFGTETKSETNSEPSDEGYASSSPPITPIIEYSRTHGSQGSGDGFVLAETRLSFSSVRRQANGRKDSIDAIKAFRQTARNVQPVDDAFDSDEEDDVFREAQDKTQLDDEVNNSLEAIEGPESPLIVVPPEDEEKTATHPLYDSALLPSQNTIAVGPPEDDDQVNMVDDQTRGILNFSFTFPSPSTNQSSSETNEIVPAKTTTATTKRSPRRWTDPPKYHPTPSSDSHSPATKHRKRNSYCLDRFAGAVSKSRVYMGQVNWTQVGIATAGVIAGGLLSMARRH